MEQGAPRGVNIATRESDMPDDRETLIALNADDIRSVQNGDVRRLDEILADDFLC